jgi:hypothetical protein
MDKEHEEDTMKLLSILAKGIDNELAKENRKKPLCIVIVFDDAGNYKGHATTMIEDDAINSIKDTLTLLESKRYIKNIKELLESKDYDPTENN